MISLKRIFFSSLFLVGQLLAMGCVHGMNQLNEQNNCTICFSDFAQGKDLGKGVNKDEDGEQLLPAENLRRFKCPHIFHKECIEKWLKENETCPYCRQIKKLTKLDLLRTIVACTIAITGASLGAIHADAFSTKQIPLELGAIAAKVLKKISAISIGGIALALALQIERHGGKKQKIAILSSSIISILVVSIIVGLTKK